MNETSASQPAIRVHLLPEFVQPHDIAGQTVVVVDVLRASTTLAAALAAGARGVIPCLEVAEARNLARRRPSSEAVLLGGERGGTLIPGFDLGNSPREYSAERVAGRTVIFTTTNGTRALMRCVGANEILWGSFVNLSAVARRIRAETNVQIVCAGTDGEVSWEDTLFAGALVEQLQHQTPRQANDGAMIAWQTWREVRRQSAPELSLESALRRGRGGRRLLEIGQATDLEFAAQIDGCSVVPQLDVSDWMIRAVLDA